MTHHIFKQHIEHSKRVFESLSKDEFKELNDKQLKSVEEEHAVFKEAFENSMCCFCGSPLKTFSSKKPCLHWMLRPNGVNKKHFDELYKTVGYFQMEAYARWVANLDAPLVNINDLKDERRDGKVFETTIKYKYIEWSFSCSPSDLDGHKNAKEGNYPHFHFQMRLDKRPFINYSQNHIAFTDEDIWKLAMLSQDEIPISMNQMFGAGMGSIFTDDNVEHVLEISERTENEDEATFKFDTFVMAKPGETISGSDIADLIQESRETGVLMAKLLRRLDADVQTIVTPGNRVPEIASRTETKRNQ
jgi:hypothetical protein